MDKLGQVREIAQALSIEEVGVCRYDTDKRPLLPCRAKARLPQGAQSVIVVLFPYAVDDERPRNLSRYACVPDYHVVAGDVLRTFADRLADTFDGEVFEPFMDNSPLPEVATAVAAGLGAQGDNGLFISDRFGSFVFIGCVVTTMALPACEQDRTCVHCGRCAAVCPSGCIAVGDRQSCVSAISQKKGDLSDEQQRLLKTSGSLWGCDACQECCPMNRGKPTRPHPCFSWYRPWVTLDGEEDLADKAYGWRGRAVIARNAALLAEDDAPKSG